MTLDQCFKSSEQKNQPSTVSRPGTKREIVYHGHAHNTQHGVFFSPIFVPLRDTDGFIQIEECNLQTPLACGRLAEPSSILSCLAPSTMERGTWSTEGNTGVPVNLAIRAVMVDWRFGPREQERCGHTCAEEKPSSGRFEAKRGMVHMYRFEACNSYFSTEGALSFRRGDATALH